MLLGLLSASEYHYSYLPKRVYTTQVFPVTLLAKETNPSQPIRFQFDPRAPVRPLSPLPVRVINGHDVFYTFYFTAQSAGDITIPALTIDANGHTFHLSHQTILAVPFLQTDPDVHHTFCGLIATDCRVTTSQVSMFDSNTTLVTLTLEAHEGNPEALHIPQALEQNVEKIHRQNATVTAEYYFVIPSSIRQITLSYYNTAQHRFVPMTLSTDYHNQPVAAQVDLAPVSSPFDRLKLYGLSLMLLFFLLMYWWQRDWLYLILVVVIALMLYPILRPHQRLCVQEGSPLYILPARNSRTSLTLPEELHTRSLGHHAIYDKIKYHNTIGWIRHEDLCQD